MQTTLSADALPDFYSSAEFLIEHDSTFEMFSMQQSVS